MAEPFIGEIRLFGFGFQPNGWEPCNGQLLAIRQNQALFAVLGTSYGGDGATTFALPNLVGRVAVHPPAGGQLGVAGGAEQVALTIAELPAHTHALNATAAAATSNVAAANVWANTGTKNTYSSGVTKAPLGAAALTNTGENQAHPNMQPYQVGSYCIATVGIFPPRP